MGDEIESGCMGKSIRNGVAVEEATTGACAGYNGTGA
jgi:hypothetical protein